MSDSCRLAGSNFCERACKIPRMSGRRSKCLAAKEEPEASHMSRWLLAAWVCVLFIGMAEIGGVSGSLQEEDSNVTDSCEETESEDSHLADCQSYHERKQSYTKLRHITSGR